MRKFMRKRLKKGLSLVLTFIMVFNVVFSFQMEQAHAKINVNNDKLPDGYVLVKKTDKTIAPGISETETIFYKGIMPSETGFRFSSGL